MAVQAPDLLPRLAAFARLLHDAGLDGGPGRLTTATKALGFIDLRDRAGFRDTLRACFVGRREELPVFEAAFDIFWAPPDPRVRAGFLPGKSRPLPLAPDRARSWMQALGLNQGAQRPGDLQEVVNESSGYSADELLRHKDFDEMSWEETEQVKRLLQQSPWRIAQRAAAKSTSPAQRGSRSALAAS